jgi:hypothetical protein
MPKKSRAHRIRNSGHRSEKATSPQEQLELAISNHFHFLALYEQAQAEATKRPADEKAQAEAQRLKELELTAQAQVKTLEYTLKNTHTTQEIQGWREQAENREQTERARANKIRTSEAYQAIMACKESLEERSARTAHPPKTREYRILVGITASANPGLQQKTHKEIRTRGAFNSCLSELNSGVMVISGPTGTPTHFVHRDDSLFVLRDLPNGKALGQMPANSDMTNADALFDKIEHISQPIQLTWIHSTKPASWEFAQLLSGAAPIKSIIQAARNHRLPKQRRAARRRAKHTNATPAQKAQAKQLAQAHQKNIQQLKALVEKVRTKLQAQYSRLLNRYGHEDEKLLNIHNALLALNKHATKLEAIKPYSEKNILSMLTSSHTDHIQKIKDRQNLAAEYALAAIDVRFNVGSNDYQQLLAGRTKDSFYTLFTGSSSRTATCLVEISKIKRAIQRAYPSTGHPINRRRAGIFSDASVDELADTFDNARPLTNQAAITIKISMACAAKLFGLEPFNTTDGTYQIAALFDQAEFTGALQTFAQRRQQSAKEEAALDQARENIIGKREGTTATQVEMQQIINEKNRLLRANEFTVDRDTYYGTFDSLTEGLTNRMYRTYQQLQALTEGKNHLTDRAKAFIHSEGKYYGPAIKAHLNRVADVIIARQLTPQPPEEQRPRGSSFQI